jgi:hypothetical protein
MSDFGLIVWMFIALALGASAANTGPGDLWLCVTLALAAVGAGFMAVRSAR